MLAATSATPALANEGTEPIRIEYRAPDGAGCPSAREFEAKVFARTASARAATDDEPARSFVIELRRAGSRVAGSLVIQETDGATMARRVTGSECADVATVLALATALAIDPRAELAPHQTLDEETESESQLEPSSRPPSYEPPSVPSGAWTPRWALGATVAFAVAPRPALGASLLLALERHGVPPFGEFGVELVYRQTGSEAVRDARATFHFYAARPGLCAAGVALGASLLLAPCLLVEVGAISGVGSEIPNSTRTTRFWAAGELQARLELGLGSGGFVTLDGGVQLPLTRYRFVFENPDTQIHDVPVVAAQAGLRVGTSF
jgi:hypothetical protein